MESLGAVFDLFRTAGPEDATGRRILDAALASMESVGIRRTSVEQVARDAGVSHMTVYRRWPSKQDLVYAVGFRELRRILDRVGGRMLTVLAAPSVGDVTLTNALAESFAAGTLFVREHALFQRVLAVEPELILPVLTVDAGPAFAWLRTLLAALLADAGIDEGVDPERAAELIIRISQSLLLTPESTFDLGSEEALKEFARAAFVPIISKAP